MTARDRCKERVRIPGLVAARYHQCSRAAVKDGFCKQHHPDAVKAREEKKVKDWNEKQSRSLPAQMRRLADANQALQGDSERLQFVMRAVSGKALRDAGIVYAAADIDSIRLAVDRAIKARGDDLRDAFEEWAFGLGLDIATDTSGENYKSPRTADIWQGWRSCGEFLASR